MQKSGLVSCQRIIVTVKPRMETTLGSNENEINEKFRSVEKEKKARKPLKRMKEVWGFVFLIQNTS